MPSVTMGQDAEKLRYTLRQTEQRLAAVEATLQAIRNGEVDALVVDTGGAPAVYTLKSAGEPYRLLIEQMADGALTVSHDGVILYCNAAFAAMMRRPRERLIGSSFQDVINGDGAVPCVSGECCSSLETSLKTASGVLPVVISCSQIEVGGDNVACILVTDVSKQRKTLQHALAAARAGVWTWEIPTDNLIWSPENDAVFGVEAGRVRNRADWAALLEPEDVATASKGVDDVLAGRSDEYHTEFRITHPNGEVRWILGLGRLEHAPDGTPLRMRGINLDITERKRAEIVLRSAHDTLRQLVEKSPFGVYIIDSDFRFAYSSASVEKLFDGRPLVGRQFGDMLRTVRSDEYVDERLAMFRDTLETGRSHGGTVSTQRRGTILEESFEWRIDRITLPDGRPGVLCHYYDLSERIQHEAELRKSEERYRMLHESLRDAFVRTDMQGNLLEFNELFCQKLGYQPEELHALTYQDLTPSRWHAADEKILREQIIKRGYSEVYEKEYRRKDGSLMPVELRTVLYRDQAGNPESMWAIVRDITERKANEARLRSLNEQLMHVGRVSELSQVSATIAHELNQPLAAMLNYVGTAKRLVAANDPASWRKATEAIEKAGEQAMRASEIIRRTRSFVERRATERKAENINAIVEESLALGLIGAKAESISTHVELAPDLPPLLADRVQIQQVLVNLLRNAIDAISDSAKREIFVATRMVEGARVEVSVADTGPGVAHELASRLFKPFVTTKPGGMGIGLAISRSIIEAHGGEMGVKAGEGGGALFWFTLPVKSKLRDLE